MGKHIIDKAKDTAIEWSNSAKRVYRIGKSKIKKGLSNLVEKNYLADKKVLSKNGEYNSGLKGYFGPTERKNGGAL